MFVSEMLLNPTFYNFSILVKGLNHSCNYCKCYLFHQTNIPCPNVICKSFSLKLGNCKLRLERVQSSSYILTNIKCILLTRYSEFCALVWFFITCLSEFLHEPVQELSYDSIDAGVWHMCIFIKNSETYIKYNKSAL